MGLHFRHTTNLGGGNRITYSKRIGGGGNGGGVWKFLLYLIFLPVVLLVLLWRGLAAKYGSATAWKVIGCVLAGFVVLGVIVSIFEKPEDPSALSEPPAAVEAAEEPAPQTLEEITPTAEEALARSLPVASPVEKPEQKPAETDQKPAETEQKPAEAPALKDSEATVWIAASREGDRYHRENCRWIKDGKIEIPLSEAEKAGFTPCKTCKP